MTLPYCPPEVKVAIGSAFLLVVSAASFAALRWIGKAISEATVLPAVTR